MSSSIPGRARALALAALPDGGAPLSLSPRWLSGREAAPVYRGRRLRRGSSWCEGLTGRSFGRGWRGGSERRQQCPGDVPQCESGAAADRLPGRGAPARVWENPRGAARCQEGMTSGLARAVSEGVGGETHEFMAPPIRPPKRPGSDNEDNAFDTRLTERYGHSHTIGSSLSNL